MRWLLIALLIVFAGVARAATGGEQSFADGMRAFEAGNYTQALKAFEAARAAGYRGVDLDYNLGVTQYRLGDYAAARASFLRVTHHPPMAALAHYNLGLTALRASDPSEARRHFALAHDGSGDATLRTLADIQLERLDRAPAADARWHGLGQLGVGYDDNVIEPDLLTPSARSDSYWELFGSLGGPLTGTNAHGLRLELIGYGLAYRDLDTYDLAFGRGTLAWTAPRGRWRTEVGVYGEHSTLGGDPYLAGAGPVLRARRALTPATELDLRYRYDRIDARDPAYAPLDGSRQQAEIALDWRGARSGLRLAAEFELNDRDDLRGPGVFTSYSPTRHGLRAIATLPPRGAWEPEVEFGCRLSEYNDPNVLSGGTRITRDDRRCQAGVRLARGLGGGWQLHGEYLHTNNDSNLATYDYRRNLASLGVALAF